MHRLRYFISWLAIILSTLSIILLFLLLIFLVKDFENPGGIYFYIYFIFPPLWFIFSFLFTGVGSFIVSRKLGIKRVLQTIFINILTGIGFFALIFLVLHLYSSHLKQKREQKITTIKANLQVQDIQWVEIDVDKDNLFDHIQVHYALNAKVDVGMIHTFIVITLNNGSLGPFLMTNDDNTYNRTQEITKGNWVCELLLDKYSWDKESEDRLRSISKAENKVLSISIREESYTDRLPEELVKSVTPITINFSNLDIDLGPLTSSGRDSSQKRNICTKI